MEDKKRKVLLVITIIILIVLVFGATYAYFVAQTGLGASANMNIQAGTTDSLMFEVGSNIIIDANQENFGKDKGNLVGTTSAKAVFKPGSTPNENPYKYNVFFIINDNNFVYTRDDNTPELIMKITSPTGEQIENIIGLNYTNDAFDITGKLGSFLLAKDYEITGINEVTQEWLVEVTLVNLDSDQQENTGKTFSGSIFITTENIDTYIPSKIENMESTTTIDSITVTANVTEGTREIDKYYFAIEELTSPIAYNEVNLQRLSNSNEDLTWYESDEPTYNFTNLKENTYYKVYSYGMDKNNIKTNIKEQIFKTNALTISYVCQGKNLANCIRENYSLDETIIYHNGTIKNSEGNIIDAGDNSYRYAGVSESVNNFVCFGSDAEVCPTNNLYRIIGVFGDQVKLIKYDYATKEQLGTDGDYYGSDKTPDATYYKGSMITIPYYSWNKLNGTNSTNDWTLSRLNKINLNEVYLTSLGEVWTNKIANTTWNINGGINLLYNANAKTAYDYELGENKRDITYKAKIGLMYLSEYYYSASPEHWTKPGYDSTDGGETRDYRSTTNQNWMYMGDFDWTISPNMNYSNYAYLIDSAGNTAWNKVEIGNRGGVRPTFSLTSDVVLLSGEGTKSNPYRIKI